MPDPFAMKLDDFPWTSPDTFATVRAALIDDPDLRLQELDGIFRTNTNAAAAEITFAGDEVNHQWCSTLQTESPRIMSRDALNHSLGM